MSTTPAIAPEAPAPISPIGRIFGVFFSPKTTFEDIARKPGWIAPAAVLIAISIALSISLARHVDWVEVTKDQIAKSKFASRQFEQLDEAQKDRAYQQGAERSKAIRYVRGVVGWPLLLLIMAGIYLGAFK